MLEIGRYDTSVLFFDALQYVYTVHFSSLCMLLVGTSELQFCSKAR